MGGSFKTDPGHSNERLRPLRLAMRKEHLFGTAKELVEDLPNLSAAATLADLPPRLPKLPQSYISRDTVVQEIKSCKTIC